MFDFLFKDTRRPSRVVRVKITSGASVRPWDEKDSRSFGVGETVDVDPATAADLVGSNRAERLGLVGPDGNLLPPESPAPRKALAPYEPQPYPEQWADLPAPFQAAWKLDEELAKRRDALGRAQKENTSAGMIVGVSAVALESERSERIIEKIMRAEDAVRSFDRSAISRAYLACSEAALNEIRGANASRDAAEKLGLEIFAQRVAALELHPDKIRNLFYGSALHVKYFLEPVHEPTLRNAGNGKSYIDTTLEGVAHLIFRARKLRALATARIGEGKAELEAAATPATPRKAKAAA